MHGVRYEKGGFTLIELLVVMAIVAIFLGVLGMALSRGNPTVATQGGQRSISGLATGARAQAILNQSRVRLIVHCDPPLPGDSAEVQKEKRDRYLRYIGMVVWDLDTRVWKTLNEGVSLPRGVYIVPPVGLDPSLLPTSVNMPNADADWAHARRSVVACDSKSGAVKTVTHEYNSKHPAQTYFYIEFNGRGMVDMGQFPGSNEGRLVITPAQETPTTPNFANKSDNAVLGGVFRSYGSLALVHDPAAFPKIEP